MTFNVLGGNRMIRNDLSILVADDMPLSCEAIRGALTKNGYHNIRIANTANEALTLLAAHPADIVLADWIMPGMDGLELTDRIRQQDEENNQYTSVILFTAKASEITILSVISMR